MEEVVSVEKTTTTSYSVEFTPAELIDALGLRDRVPNYAVMTHRLNGSPANHAKDTVLDMHDSKFLLHWTTVEKEQA